MALKEGLPAIRAKWLWDWQKRGTVATIPLLGTRVLIVSESAYAFKTCYQQENDRVVKKPHRYWLGEGVILVPRWDSLDIHFDPVADKDVEVLELDELREQGMYRLKNGENLVLIYQHVEDALHFQRQQWHIRLESYAAELKEIAKILAEIEKRALQNISAKEGKEVEIFRELGSLKRHHRRRRQEISRILTQLAVRERAAEILVNSLRRELQRAQKGIQGVFGSEPMKDLLAGTPTSIKGLRGYLVWIYQNLNQMKVRPVVRSLKSAQHYLLKGLGALDVGEGEKFKHQLELAMDRLIRAQGLLQHPPEKIEGLKPTAQKGVN